MKCKHCGKERKPVDPTLLRGPSVRTGADLSRSEWDRLEMAAARLGCQCHLQPWLDGADW